jgi:hypothetical protein
LVQHQGKDSGLVVGQSDMYYCSTAEIGWDVILAYWTQAFMEVFPLLNFPISSGLEIRWLSFWNNHFWTIWDHIFFSEKSETLHEHD